MHHGHHATLYVQARAMKADLSLAAALELQVSEKEKEKAKPPSWDRDRATKAAAAVGGERERAGEHEDDSQGRKWFVGKASPPSHPRVKGPDPSHGDGKRPSPKYGKDHKVQPQPPPSKPSGRGRMGMDSGARKDAAPASAVSGKMGMQKKVLPSYVPVLQDRKGSEKSEVRDIIPSPLSPEQYPFFDDIALFDKSPRKDIHASTDAPVRKMSTPMRPASPLDLDVGTPRGVRVVQDALLIQGTVERGEGRGGGTGEGRGFDDGAMTPSTMQLPYNLSKSSPGMKDPTHHGRERGRDGDDMLHASAREIKRSEHRTVSEDERKMAEDAEGENYAYEDDGYEDDFIIAEHENKAEHKDDISMLTDESKGKETSSSSTENFRARKGAPIAAIPFATLKEELEGERSAERTAGGETVQEQKYPAFNSFSTIGDTRDTPASQESARSPCYSDAVTFMEYSKSSAEEGSDETKNSAPTNLIAPVPSYQPPTFVPPVQSLIVKPAVKSAGVMPTLAEMRRQKEEALKVKEESLQQVQVPTSVGPIRPVEEMAPLKAEKGEPHPVTSLSPVYKGDRRMSGGAPVPTAVEDNENESDDGYGDEEFHVSDDDEKRDKHGRA